MHSTCSGTTAGKSVEAPPPLRVAATSQKSAQKAASPKPQQVGQVKEHAGAASIVDAAAPPPLVVVRLAAAAGHRKDGEPDGHHADDESGAKGTAQQVLQAGLDACRASDEVCGKVGWEGSGGLSRSQWPSGLTAVQERGWLGQQLPAPSNPEGNSDSPPP